MSEEDQSERIEAETKEKYKYSQHDVLDKPELKVLLGNCMLELSELKTEYEDLSRK